MPYRGKHEFYLYNSVLVGLICMLLLVSTGCTGFRVCAEGDPWFGQDKVKHFVGSAVAAAGVTLIAENNGAEDSEEAALIGFSASMALGTTKEVLDETVRDYCFSWKDLVWDFLGASVGASIAAAASE